MNTTIRKMLVALLMLPAFSALMMANGTVTVPQVSGTVSITSDVDYVVTDADPFADGAILDIVNTENAVAIFPNVKPSALLNNHLSHIRINGARAVKNSNCMVKIYANGSMVLPHGTGIRPLTVYTEKGQAGESTQYGVSTRVSLEGSAFNNKIQSFTLKRGYMVWFATKSSNTNPGYNRIFIADKADLKVDLPAILSSSISALRVSQWNDASKKGFCSWQQEPNELLNTTWHYNWDAGNNPSDDREYVTQQHHRDKSSGYWWPSFTEVGNNGTSANVVTYNEPDNTGDDREHPATVQQVLEIWPQLMATGRRLGSPAVAGNLNWLYEFMDSIDARGWRCDFVVMHCYWYSDWSSWNSQLSGVRNRTGRPIWITEMNYGANWTGWPGSNTEANDANYAIHKQHFAPIVDGLEATSWLERYCVYNAVQACRNVIDANGNLTPSGEYYANKKSGLAYNSSYYVTPKLPKMKDPSELTVNYDGKTTTATLKWKEYNGEYNTSVIVQRKKSSATPWEDIAVITPQEGAATYTYQDTEAMNGYSYRVQVIDAAGKDRSTRIRQAVLGDVSAGDAVQVDGEVLYAGANIFIDGDFDMGGMGWTDGAGTPVNESAYFSVFPVGGTDGGAYLHAHGNTLSLNDPQTLLCEMEVNPGQNYYYAISLLNPDLGYHRLTLGGDAAKGDSTVASLIQSAQWASQEFNFNSSTFSKITFSGRNMKAKTQLDKAILCPLFASKEEAIADGVKTARVKATYVNQYLVSHPELQAELTALVESVTGTDEAALFSLTSAINMALEGAKAKCSLDSMAAYLSEAVALKLAGYEELQEKMTKAENAQTATAYCDALAEIREELAEYLPMVYAPDIIQAPNFNKTSVGWTVKCGTYKGGDQRLNNDMAGKTCWNAWWSGLNASEGTAKTMEITQSLKKLSHGVYALECKAGTQHGCLSDQHAYMVLGTDTLSSEKLTYDRLDLTSVADSAKWETLVTPPVYVGDNGSFTIGFIGSKQGAVDNAWKELGNASSTGDKREGWWCATDFTLRHIPMYKTTVPEGSWGVICLPRAIASTKGFQLYHIEGILSDYTALCLEEVSEGEAGVPYVYHSTNETVCFFEEGEKVDMPSLEDPVWGDFYGGWEIPAGCYYMEGGQWYRATDEKSQYLTPYTGYINSALDFTPLDSWAGLTMPIQGAVEEWAAGIRRPMVDGVPTSAKDGIYTIDGKRIEHAIKGVYIRVQNGMARKVVNQ